MPMPSLADMSVITTCLNENPVSESIASTDFTEDTQLEYGRIHPEPCCESLLSLLDDKNRTIANLQNQIQNQKMQLQYYMSNRLSSTKIHELAESCSAYATEESMPVNLAMNKFYNQMGLKTKLSGLYERMRTIDRRIVGSLEDQEFILRKIVNKLCDFLRQQSCHVDVEFKVQFAGFLGDPRQIQLFDGLVDATTNLRKALDCFKICCDKLLTVEEERNAIVDQVYSMPAEQRMNCNYLLRIQMEKMQLENEIKRMLKHQVAGSKRIKELNVIESILSNLQYQLRCSYAEKDESRISQMLRKVGSEAKLLLAMAQEQRRRYEAEMTRRSADPLGRALACVRLAVDCPSPSKTELIANGIASPEEIRSWELIKNQVDRLRSRLHAEFSEKIHSKSAELENIKSKWRNALLENNKLKLSLKVLKQELKDTTSDNDSDLKRLVRERDAYKSQVEDLETIREAYAQLVDRRPNSNTVEREYLKQLDEKDKKICDLEEENSALRKEMNNVKRTIKDQEEEIDILNRFLNLSKSPCVPVLEQNEEHALHDPGNFIFDLENKEITDPLEVSEIINVYPTAAESFSKASDNPSQLNLLALARPQSSAGGKSSKVLKANTEIVNFTEARSSAGRGSLTCLKICSRNLCGQTMGLVEAVIKTNSCVEGNLKVDDPATFSLEFKCQQGEDFVERETDFVKVDEYELHRDCSNETIPQECRPKRKKYLKGI